MKRIWLKIYYSIVIKLPINHSRLGKLIHSQSIRYIVCRKIFKSIGRGVNIEKGARFGNGFDVVIGDNSGIGVACVVPHNIIIGENVMMGPGCHILLRNHDFSRTDIPMISQGYSEPKQTIIEDDVWIGRNVTFTPGRHVAKGSIVAACTVLCKDFPAYSIIGGNPSKLIKNRKD